MNRPTPPDGGHGASAVAGSVAPVPQRLWRRRRCLAAAIDTAAALVLGSLLASSLGQWSASRAAILFAVGEPGSAWTGPLPLMLGAIGNLSYAWPLLLLLMLAPELFLGRGLGKSLVGVRVQTAPSSTAVDDAGNHAPRCLLRGVAKLAPCLLWAVALLSAQPVWAWMAALTAVWVWIAAMPLLFGRAALYDRLAGTRVARSSSWPM